MIADRLSHVAVMVAVLAPIAASIVFAQGPAQEPALENVERWEPLKNPFPSTGGGGIVIHDYNPVVTGTKCVTNFAAVTPDGTKYLNIVEFDAVPLKGGVLCTNGAWRAVDGSANGTTPFRVFLKDGVARGSP